MVTPLYVAITEGLAQRVNREEGQGMVEYALILVLIAIVVISVLIIVGKHVTNTFSSINSGLK